MVYLNLIWNFRLQQIYTFQRCNTRLECNVLLRSRFKIRSRGDIIVTIKISKIYDNISRYSLVIETLFYKQLV